MRVVGGIISDSLSPHEAAGQGDHAEEHLQHLPHHVDLPPQLVLSLLAVPVHRDVQALVELEGGGEKCGDTRELASI